METLRLNKNQISIMTEIINRGGVIAFPTDTVYGLAVRYDMPEAVQRMKDAKQRPETKPFPMMVSNKHQIESVAVLNDRSHQLIDYWMPGALTIVFDKKPEIADSVTNGFSTIGIRMPDDSFVLELINRVGVPLLVPSANISGEATALTSDDVLQQLEGRIDAVVVGESGGTRSSTVLDSTKEDLIVLRQGPISLDDILKTINKEEQI